MWTFHAISNLVLIPFLSELLCIVIVALTIVQVGSKLIKDFPFNAKAEIHHIT